MERICSLCNEKNERRNQMGKTLYLECNAGISGDMAVAALLDLGADKDVLLKTLQSMPVQGYQVEIRRTVLAGLDVCDFNVTLEEDYENHDHNMEYLHHHDHDMECLHDYNDKDHYKEQEMEGHHYAHTHPSHHSHRGLAQIQEIIKNSNMTERAKEIALQIFMILAQAEAKAHGKDISQVHFHEVGAVDSIVDIAGFAICLDNLDITEVIIPSLCEGKGTIQCQHGILSIPVPAVVNIVQMQGIKLQLKDVYGELVTPTGAAIAAAIKTSEELPEQFLVEKIGMGAGKRSYKLPSILRAMLIKSEKKEQQEEIYKLETEIDDCTGEILGYVMEQLFQYGARDVYYTPAFMKKNRPAYQLTVICKKESIERLEQILFKETTTIGIRRIKMERTILERQIETLHLKIGDIKVKKCTLLDGTIRVYPEYETIAELARKTGLAIQDIIQEIYKTLDTMEIEKNIIMEKNK